MQLADVYRKAWNNVEVAGLEMLFGQLSASENRLLAYLDKARREVRPDAAKKEKRSTVPTRRS